MVKSDLKRLLEVGAHFGHQSKRWDPKMDKYLYGVNGGVHIFDLIQTKKGLDEALGVLTDAAKQSKKILFVGTKRQGKELVKRTAKETGSFWVTERWLGGTFTNFDQIQNSLRKLDELKGDKKEGKHAKYTKKERLLLDREIDRLERFFGGIVGMDVLPEVMVILDVKREHTAISEAIAKSVSIIGIVDSNADPDGIEYVIPMNDDATSALNYILELMSQAILEGKKKGSTSAKSTKAKTKTKVKTKTKK